MWGLLGGLGDISGLKEERIGKILPSKNSKKTKSVSRFPTGRGFETFTNTV